MASHNKGSASLHHTKSLRHCITQQRIYVIASHNKGFASLHHSTKGLRHCIIQQRVASLHHTTKGLCFKFPYITQRVFMFYNTIQNGHTRPAGAGCTCCDFK